MVTSRPLVAGSSPVVPASVARRATGAPTPRPGVAPEWSRQLYDLAVTGRLDEARQVQSKIIKLFDAMLYSADFPEGVRVAVQRRRIRMGPGRQPLGEKHQATLAQLDQTFADLLAPLDGHDRRSGAAAAAITTWEAGQINRIVDGLLAALREAAPS